MSIRQKFGKIFGRRRSRQEIVALQEEVHQLAIRSHGLSNDLFARIEMMQREILERMHQDRQNQEHRLDQVYDALAQLRVSLEDCCSEELKQLPARINRLEDQQRGVERALVRVEQAVYQPQDGVSKSGRASKHGFSTRTPPKQDSPSAWIHPPSSTKAKTVIKKTVGCLPLTWWQWVLVTAFVVTCAFLAIWWVERTIEMTDWWEFGVGVTVGILALTIIFTVLAALCHRHRTAA